MANAAGALASTGLPPLLLFDPPRVARPDTAACAAITASIRSVHYIHIHTIIHSYTHTHTHTHTHRGGVRAGDGSS